MLIGVFLSGVVVLGVTFAEEETPPEPPERPETIRLKLWVNTSKFVKNDVQITDLDPAPTTKSPPLPSELSGNTYMPVRAVFEALGADVQWIADDRRVDVQLGREKLQLWVDNVSTAKINDKEVTIYNVDESKVLYPTIVDGRTMLPLRFACESLRADVNWIESEAAIEIVYPSEIREEPPGKGEGQPPDNGENPPPGDGESPPDKPEPPGDGEGPPDRPEPPGDGEEQP